MENSMETVNILVINNAPKGVTEFVQPFTAFFSSEGAACEVAEYAQIPPISKKDYQGIILSGSPRGNDIVDHHAPYFRWIETCHIPILGICAGHHIVGHIYGARLLRSEEKEKGDCFITIDEPNDPLFKNCPSPLNVRKTHNDSITLPPRFIHLAHSHVCEVEAVKHPQKPLYTTQFHPEFLNTQILRNFLQLAREYC